MAHLRRRGRAQAWAGARAGPVRGKQRLLLRAHLGGVAAAGHEPATDQVSAQVGGQPGDRVEALAPVLVEAGDRLEQGLRVGVAHRIEQVVRARALDDLAGVHDHHPVGAGGDDAHVVRDEQDGHVEASRAARRCRSRIWAWMVTSRAVVGSSAINSFGSQARAMAIITRWRRPPDNWCGYCWSRSSGRGMPTRRSTSTARSSASLLGRPLVDADGLGDLAPDRPRGVQRCHRVLEDHPDVVAADLAHVRLAQGDQVAAVQPDGPARDMADIGQQLHH